MDSIVTLLESPNAWVVVAIASLIIPIIAIVGGLIQKTLQTKQVETTRREVAAYVAEGTMHPDDAAMILSARPGANMRKLRREHT